MFNKHNDFVIHVKNKTITLKLISHLCGVHFSIVRSWKAIRSQICGISPSTLHCLHPIFAQNMQTVNVSNIQT